MELSDNSDPNESDIANGLVKEINLEIDEIYEDNYFGDYEILNNKKCQVTIIAYTPCQIISLNKVDFSVLVPE